MRRGSFERGASSAPLLFLVLAAVLVGGVLLFMNVSNVRDVNAQSRNTGVRPHKAKTLAEPNVRAPIKVLADEEDKIVAGELIKYRDKDGNEHFRSLEPIEGTAANGNVSYWFASMTVGDPVGRAQDRARANSKKSTGGKQMPRLVSENGKLVLKKK